MNNYLLSYQTKTKEQILFRYLQLSDVDEMTKYINKLSQEDTYITFSGEKISRNEEKKFIVKSIKDIVNHDSVIIVALAHKHIIGICDVTRNKSDKKRGWHVGNFGVSVSKQYRGKGIGKKLIEITIQEAIKNIKGLKQIQLECYGPNIHAQALYKTIGFKEYGRIPKAILYRNKYVDKVIMAYQVSD